MATMVARQARTRIEQMAMTAALKKGVTIALFIGGWGMQLLAAEKDDRLTASGTGFFISSSGYFLTNNHVIQGASKIRIRSKETIVDARVITVDSANDVALLKAEGTFQWLILKKSAEVSLGDDVFTIGFPNPQLQGLTPKLTRGTISAKAGIGDDPRLFQVSIPIQPGNSGGPLVDENGYVVGIVNATLSASAMLRSSGALPQNVNYAIKSAYIIPLVEAILPHDGSPPSRTDMTKHGIIADAESAVGLVLVYSAFATAKSVAKDKAKTPPSDTSSIAAKLKELEKKLEISVASHDRSVPRALLATLLADDFFGVFANGDVGDKTTALKRVGNNTDTYEFARCEGLNVQVNSPTLAIVTGIAREKGRQKMVDPLIGLFALQVPGWNARAIGSVRLLRTYFCGVAKALKEDKTETRESACNFTRSSRGSLLYGVRAGVAKAGRTKIADRQRLLGRRLPTVVILL